MQRVFRPLAVFTVATGVGVAVGLRAAMIGSTGVSAGDAFSTGYDLAQIELVRGTLYHVDQSYVDERRVDWDHMVVAGLDAVEAMVPSVMFTRSLATHTLAVDVGDHHTVIPSPMVVDREGAERVLEEVAALLADHVSPEDLPAPLDGEPAGPPLARLEYALVNGMLSTLDPHSVLLPPEAAHEMDLDNQGEFGGLGITIGIDDEHRQLTIECPIPGTPAADAGVLAHDRVLRIDGESTVNMTLDDAIRHLRGPVGSVAHLVVAREGQEEPVSIDVKRALIDSNPVESALLEGNVGWIRIQSFHEKVSTAVVDALGDLHREARGDLTGLVLDVRDNPGGFLTQAVRVADLFLEEGDIVSTVDGSGRETEPPDVATEPAEPRYPIVVLVDAHSASASEILAGALRYDERAVIVGERTFGKGSVQNLQTFFDDSKLKLTISRYLTPGDRSIQGVGIPADVELVPAVFDDAGVSLFHRERVRREADLAAALDAATAAAEEPAYRLPFVAPPAGRECSDGPDLAADRELSLARLLLVSAGRGWRRPDVLAGTAKVLAGQQRAVDAEIVAAFAKRGVDWSDGPAGPRQASRPVTLAWQFGESGHLSAGADEVVSLTVTNPGDTTWYRLSAVVEGTSALGGAELHFGKVEPGQSVTRTVPLQIPHGDPTEHLVVPVSLRDAGGVAWREDVAVDVVGNPLPRVVFTVASADSGGDGRLDPGETLTLTVSLDNVGGPSVAPFVRLRNRAGRNAELVVARYEPGALAPGGHAEGTLTLKVADLPDLPALAFDLEVGDDVAYDRGAVVRGEHYEWYQQRLPLVFTPTEALPASARHEPPVVELTRSPSGEATGRITLSGMARDDAGLSEVLVFVGSDKVFTDGRRGGVTFGSIPFTADIELEPGANTLSVLARDAEGLVSSHSVVVFSQAPQVLAKAPE